MNSKEKIKDLIKIVDKVEGEKNPFKSYNDLSKRQCKNKREAKIYIEAYLRIVDIIYHKKYKDKGGKQ